MNFKYYYDEEDEYELEVDNYDFLNDYINSDYRSYHGCKEVKTSSITFTNKFKNEFISLLKGGYNIDARIVLLLDKSPDNSLYSEPDSLVYPYFFRSLFL